jgi:hypothetical protein
MIDATCLYSTVKNTSGRSMYFGFLPPHGKTLANDEEATVFGDIREAMFRKSQRKCSYESLMTELDGDHLTIVLTPAPILWDDSLGHSKSLLLHNGALTLGLVCWDVSVS